MAETDEIASEEAPPKRGKKGLIVIVVLALVAGAGGWFAISSGALDGLLALSDEEHAEEEESVARAPAPADANVVFVDMPPISVSVGTGGRDRQLRMQAVLEVTPDAASHVEGLLPRLQDGFLGYLRAIGPAPLEEEAGLLRIRAQMLRRARMIAGPEGVRNVLVTDFILN
ncbi:flagellar basal body-associated FliL family protein [Jannaschia aquimarina]|uniref:Flagellar protein FliL n=1 Tax=Jannaschia aquimarina TaxID=935700 RepID=A0A0D1EBN4_9RHOB|nr:flagellar basal body-associated FliL family protein [Jannaschia aquimarina]KIT14286.1 Flagellar FliL protein [Jannaschia aquimarina]SNS50039.1 flagellar FliL protein [Jannaschia aquimarina]